MCGYFTVLTCLLLWYQVTEESGDLMHRREKLVDTTVKSWGSLRITGFLVLPVGNRVKKVGFKRDTLLLGNGESLVLYQNFGSVVETRKQPWLVHLRAWTPGRVAVACSCATHSTLTVPLSIEEYKWLIEGWNVRYFHLCWITKCFHLSTDKARQFL